MEKLTKGVDNEVNSNEANKSKKRRCYKNNIGFVVDAELKDKFMEDAELHGSTSFVNLIRRTLLLVDEYEKRFSTSVYKLSSDENKKMFKWFGAKSTASLNAYLTSIKKYIEFVESLGVEVEKNIDSISSSDLEDLIDKEAHEERYITREELIKVVSNAKNPQDQALLLLIFEGIKGKGYSDLRFLKEKDIDFSENIITLKDKVICVECMTTMYVLNKAINQSSYYAIEDGEIITEYPINPNNPYVIKKMAYKSKGLDAFAEHRMMMKIANFTKSLDKEYLTGTTIYNSGLAERFLKHFNRHPDEISDKEIDCFLKENGEKIPYATLRRIGRYMVNK